MAAIAFDTLQYASRLKAAGVPEQQAEVQAELMAEAFVFNMDALVTRDYLDACLDARFGEFEKRLDARIDKKFERVDARFAKIDERFSNIDAKFAGIDVKFAEIDGKFRLIYWMLAVIMASTTIPALHSLLTG